MALLLHGISILVILILSWTAYCGYCLYVNYQEACKIGIPIRIIPIDHLNKAWLLVDKQVISLVKRLPGKLGNNNFTRFNYRGWHEDDGTRHHDEMGDAFVMVTPSNNWMYIADPDALKCIYRRGSDFPRWTEITKMLDVFGGPNIATASGEQWKKHRKVINTSLNERTNAVVWSESVYLGDQMVRHWASRKHFTSVGEDVRTFALNILCKASFGRSYAFHGQNDIKDMAPSSSAGFRLSLLIVMENALIILALGRRFFTHPWLPLPKTGKILGEACNTFQHYMESLYKEKRQLLNENKLAGDSTLIASLARAANDMKEGASFTESEIFGTMVVVSFAGHDTTAHLVTFAMFYLAAHPSVQEWLSDECRQVLGSRPPHEWNYHTDFPRLKRCMAVLFETLRVKTLVPEVKWTSDRTQCLNIKGRRLTIPPRTLVIPSYIHVHNTFKIWGADANDWRPSRWIVKRSENTSSPPSQMLDNNNENEVLLQPPRGAYLGWSDGVRDCPGKKFSQVEWVAVMAAIFRDWKIEPRLERNESFEDGRMRLSNFVEKNTGYGGLLLQLMSPERVPLVCKQR